MRGDACFKHVHPFETFARQSEVATKVSVHARQEVAATNVRKQTCNVTARQNGDTNDKNLNFVPIAVSGIAKTVLSVATRNRHEQINQHPEK